MSDLDRIASTVRDVQEDALDDRRRRLSVRNRLLAPPKARRSTVRPLFLGAGFAAAAAIAALWIVTVPSETSSEPLTFSSEGIEQPVGELLAAPEHSPLPLRFSDGSKVELASGTTGRVERLMENGAGVRVEDGTVEVDVVHEDDTSWQIECGPYTVHVVGTRFAASWDAEAGVFDLAMDEGEVRVEGPNLPEGQSLRAGETLRLEVEEAPEIAAVELEAEVEEAGLQEMTVEEAAAEEVSVAAAVPVPAVNPQPPRNQGPDWVALASEARDAEAIAAVDVLGFDRTLTAADTNRLSLLAAVLRRSGDPRAAACYRATRERFPGTDAASNASFHLGRSSFAAGDYNAASQHLRTYLGERPQGRWAAEATGRLLEVSHRSGRESEALDLAGQYLSRFPNGSHATFARSLVER